MGKPIVGLLGLASSGKDTVAGFLVARGWSRLAFADALKAVALDLDPMVDNLGTRLSRLVDTVGWDQAKANPEVRALLQRLGVAVREHVGESTWVDVVLRQMEAERRPVVVTDVRFPNEAKALREVGATLAVLHRPGLEPPNDHPSERLAQDALACPDQYGVSYVMVNGGDLGDLRHQAERLANYAEVNA